MIFLAEECVAIEDSHQKSSISKECVTKEMKISIIQ